MGLEDKPKMVQNVYDKWIDSMDDSVKKDNYYRYFYNLLETGNNYCTISHTKLLKTVDEAWVSAIEEALPSIQNVVRNPRKYMEEDRQVVNIALARNITTESIQHLLQHSNMIDQVNEDGTVIPNRILNVYKEETLNIYENRFICTLILELQRFVNRRFNVIFEESKDETGTNFEMESTVDNYTEIIDYKLEIKIRKKQTDVDNEEENMSIFNRISKLHHQINDLASSGFMSSMGQFALVRHPIVKTNAIGKNKDYKACHKLWNYIHDYDRVGYRVDLVKNQPVVTRQFERDIYNSFLWDYTMLQEFTEELDEPDVGRPRRKKEFNLNYLRQMLNEIMEASDMTDSNLRKLVNNELTNLQMRRKIEKQGAQRAQNEKKNNAKK